jgi:cellulose synthase/poly-beta-1,6-N-acetylglucosamine synthase-like glycosyltransferase
MASVAVLTILPALYLLTLAIAAHFHPSSPPSAARKALRVVILVPAHNEEELLGRCLASLSAQTYPASLCRLLVIADNCTDATAMVAAQGGAGVMLRDDPSHPGKGQALRWAFDRLLAEKGPPDAFIIVDADSVADLGLVAGLVGAVHPGDEALQAEYLVLDDPTNRATGLRQAAFLLFHRTRFAGRATLGLPCNLVGNGMLLTAGLLRRIPWAAFTGTEDLEYSMDLRLAGVRPRFAAAALVFGPASGLGRAGATQRHRWEGGRLHVLRTHLIPLTSAILRGNRGLVDALLDLGTPPLGLLTLLTLAGGVLSLAGGMTGVMELWAGLPWAGSALLLTAYLMVGLHAARAPASAYLGLLQAPRFLGAKLITYAHLMRGTHADRWERSERPGDPVQVTR